MSMAGMSDADVAAFFGESSGVGGGGGGGGGVSKSLFAQIAAKNKQKKLSGVPSGAGGGSGGTGGAGGEGGDLLSQIKAAQGGKKLRKASDRDIGRKPSDPSGGGGGMGGLLAELKSGSKKLRKTSDLPNPRNRAQTAPVSSGTMMRNFKFSVILTINVPI